MSRFFGEIRQAGYVVNDIEKAMDYWSKTLGIGPIGGYVVALFIGLVIVAAVPWLSTGFLKF